MDHQQPFARALLVSYPQHPGALHLLVLDLIENRQGHPHSTIDFIQQTIALCPMAPAFQLSLADVRYVQNDFAAAEQACRAAITLDPHSSRHWTLALRDTLPAHRAARIALGICSNGTSRSTAPNFIASFGMP